MMPEGDDCIKGKNQWHNHMDRIKDHDSQQACSGEYSSVREMP
jgi:hypothetical protein